MIPLQLNDLDPGTAMMSEKSHLSPDLTITSKRRKIKEDYTYDDSKSSDHSPMTCDRAPSATNMVARSSRIQDTAVDGPSDESIVLGQCWIPALVQERSLSSAKMALSCTRTLGVLRDGVRKFAGYIAVPRTSTFQ